MYSSLVRSVAEWQSVRGLIEREANNCEIARITGIPRTTIREWRRHRDESWRPACECPVCGDGILERHSYAHLLGLYLGDGCISRHRREVFRLRITLDTRYPGVIEECVKAIAAVRGGGKANRTKKRGCVEVASYWKHWPCLFPQHGPGRKHWRTIALAPWQTPIAEAHAGALLRGLIQSDGCRVSNRVRVNGKTYVYPRYHFKNFSDDIRGIFCKACKALGVRWTQSDRVTLAVSRRADVALLDRYVGAKQ